ncbi:MAG: hypothetical protein KME14_20145 [Tildeniella torsiva UHER 1998/13D]|jgi:hypothetical protein|nr:hypothetical protein [Tildeniella torsiva UHER 1998/13D]
MKVEVHEELRAEDIKLQNTGIVSSNNPKNHAIRQLIFSLIEPIPRPLGTVARKLIYPLLSKNWGKAPYIQAWVEILGANNIVAGDNISILRYSLLNCNFENSLLRLGKNISLDRGVSIRLEKKLHH